jgi:hypothetical protein
MNGRPAKTVSVKVFEEQWNVPRGFGRAYIQAARAHGDPARGSINPHFVLELEESMLLVGYRVGDDAVKRWTMRERIEAVIWAQTEHLRASDNPIQRHPRPSWLPEPWAGENTTEDDLFGGLAPTIVRGKK